MLHLRITTSNDYEDYLFHEKFLSFRLSSLFNLRKIMNFYSEYNALLRFESVYVEMSSKSSSLVACYMYKKVYNGFYIAHKNKISSFEYYFSYRYYKELGHFFNRIRFDISFCGFFYVNKSIFEEFYDLNLNVTIF